VHQLKPMSKPLPSPEECQFSVSRTGFPNQLKSKNVRIDRKKMSQMIIKERLSKEAVIKEKGLGQVCFR